MKETLRALNRIGLMHGGHIGGIVGKYIIMQYEIDAGQAGFLYSRNRHERIDGSVITPVSEY
jgi:hypothetical protein